MDKSVYERIITDKFDEMHHFNNIIYFTTLTNQTKMTISVIEKYHILAARVMVLLKLRGWQLDSTFESNPTKQIVQGETRPLTFFVYHLELHPMLHSIMSEIMKDKFSKNVVLSLLDKVQSDMKKSNENSQKLLDDEKFHQAADYIFSKITSEWFKKNE